MRDKEQISQSLSIKPVLPVLKNRLVFKKLVFAMTVNLICGLLCFFASPPFFFFPALFSFSAALMVIDAYQQGKRKIILLFIFIFGYGLGNFYWLVVPLFTDIKTYFWLVPVSLIFDIGFFSFCALLCLSPFIIADKKIKDKIWLKSIIFIFSWTFFEWFRAHYVLGGFGWQPIGTIFAVFDITLQIARIIKIDGLNFLAATFAVIPFLFLKKCPQRFIFLGMNIIVMVIILIYGFLRLPTGKYNYLDGIKLVGLQANIQANKFMNRNNFNKVIQSYSDMLAKNAYRAKGTKGTLFVLPESAIPYYDNDDIKEGLLKYLGKLLPPGNNYLAFGAEYAQSKFERFNRLTFINKKGEIAGVYDKRHLAPFGEYLPFRKIASLFFSQKITGGGIDLIRGSNSHQIIRLNLGENINIAPIICFESIFSGDIIANNISKKKPQIILNVTNDIWLGSSIGIYQHLTANKIRAVEENLPLFRVSNNGISVLYDQYGRVIKKTTLNSAAVISDFIPRNNVH